MLEIIRKAQDPKRVMRALSFRLRKVWGYDDYRKFIILTRSRTGSSLLRSMLSSHPSIYAESEIFARLDGRSVESIFDHVFSKYPRFIKAVGFKIFYYHPLDDESGLVWDRIKQIPNMHIVHLKRGNVLRTILSRKIAGATDIWSVKQEHRELQVKDKQVRLTEDELFKGFLQTREWETDFGRMFGSKAIIDVYYEDLVNNPHGEFQKIIDWLCLEPFEPRTLLRRQNPEKLSDLILNYESLKERFSNTEWAGFFQD